MVSGAGSGAAIEKAIELNGEAVKMNLSAFTWGRRAAAEPELLAGMMSELKAPNDELKISETLDEVMDTIDELRAGGRCVGLVSHLSELRMRIPTQVQVVRSRSGSRIEALS